MINLNEKKQKKNLYYINYIIVFIFMGCFLWHYLYISVGQMPLMDFWINSGSFLEKVMTEPFQLSMFINFPHELHWNVLGGIFQYSFVRFLGCDNRAAVYMGMVFSFCSIILVVWIFRQYFECNKIILNSFGVILCIMPIINLNQWEIFTLYCNFAFMFRIFIYLLMFYIIDKMLHNYHNSKRDLCVIIGWAIVNVLIILFMSQAYFLGLISAEIAMAVVDCFIYRNKEKIKIYLAIFMSSVSGFIIYYLTLEKAQVTIGENISFVKRLADYFQGILIMLGSTVVPQTIAIDNINICCEIGLIILELALIAVYLFFKFKMFETTYFPLACLIYSFSSIVAIVFGRVYSFGLTTVTSSRYVVETTVGLLGLIQIYFYCLCREFLTLKKRLMIISVLTGLAVLLCWADETEMKIGPYRKAYNQSMVELALDIDNVSDEQLAIFQSSPSYVREGIEVMKKYHLLLWKD